MYSMIVFGHDYKFVFFVRKNQKVFLNCILNCFSWWKLTSLKLSIPNLLVSGLVYFIANHVFLILMCRHQFVLLVRVAPREAISGEPLYRIFNSKVPFTAFSWREVTQWGCFGKGFFGNFKGDYLQPNKESCSVIDSRQRLFFINICF